METPPRTDWAPHVGGANHFPAVVNQNQGSNISEEAGKRGSDPRWDVKPSDSESRYGLRPVSFILVAAESRRELVLDGKKKQSESWVEWRAGRGCGLVVVSPYCSNVCVTVTLLGTAGCRAGKYGWAEGGGERRNGRAACFSSNICGEAAFTFSSVWCQTFADVSFYVDYMKSNFAAVIISFYISFFFFFPTASLQWFTLTGHFFRYILLLRLCL